MQHGSVPVPAHFSPSRAFVTFMRVLDLCLAPRAKPAHTSEPNFIQNMSNISWMIAYPGTQADTLPKASMTSMRPVCTNAPSAALPSRKDTLSVRAKPRSWVSRYMHRQWICRNAQARTRQRKRVVSWANGSAISSPHGSGLKLRNGSRHLLGGPLLPHSPSSFVERGRALDLVVELPRDVSVDRLVLLRCQFLGSPVRPQSPSYDLVDALLLLLSHG